MTPNVRKKALASTLLHSFCEDKGFLLPILKNPFSRAIVFYVLSLKWWNLLSKPFACLKGEIPMYSIQIDGFESQIKALFPQLLSFDNSNGHVKSWGEV